MGKKIILVSAFLSLLIMLLLFGCTQGGQPSAGSNNDNNNFYSNSGNDCITALPLNIYLRFFENNLYNEAWIRITDNNEIMIHEATVKSYGDFGNKLAEYGLPYTNNVFVEHKISLYSINESKNYTFTRNVWYTYGGWPLNYSSVCKSLEHSEPRNPSNVLWPTTVDSWSLLMVQKDHNTGIGLLPSGLVVIKGNEVLTDILNTSVKIDGKNCLLSDYSVPQTECYYIDSNKCLDLTFAESGIPRKIMKMDFNIPESIFEVPACSASDCITDDLSGEVSCSVSAEIRSFDQSEINSSGGYLDWGFNDVEILANYYALVSQLTPPI